MTTAYASRDVQHPIWCVDHRREMLGEHGECHSVRYVALLDEHGYGLIAKLLWVDPEAEPNGWVQYPAHPSGEQFLDLSADAIEVLGALAEADPDALVGMLRHLRTSLRTEVPA